MHRSFIFGVIASVCFVWGTACMAQGIPQGSYQQTCNAVTVRGDTLVANCRDSSGEWRTASLPGFQNCSSEIRNDNGNLRCEMSGYSTPSQAVGGGGPAGSYLQSCQDVHAKGDDLHARCQTQNGDWKDAKLDDYNKCNGDIVNDDGRLRCVAGGQQGYYRGPGPAGMPNHSNVYGPQGSYTRTCTDFHVNGDDLHARCQTADGGWHDAKLDDYRKCQGDITNDNGRLRCVAGAPVGAGGPGPYGAPAAYGSASGPNGAYAQTCMDIHIDGDDLKARCQTHHGGLRDAKLDDYRKCKSDIINDDGHLRCDK